MLLSFRSEDDGHQVCCGDPGFSFRRFDNRLAFSGGIGGLRKVVNLEIFGKILVGKFRATVSNFFYRTDESLLMEIFGYYLKSVL